MPIQSVLSGQQTKGLWVPGPPKKKHDLLRVDLLSGSGRVSGSGDLQENVSEKTVKPPCSEAAEAINQIHFHLSSSKHLYQPTSKATF